jgi:hypothetical protein
MEAYWVQVDTEILRGFSKGYRTRADVFNQAGKGIQFAIQTIIENMPEYDGRLQQAARADAVDFFNQFQNFFRGFSEDSDFLIKTADAFEDVDGKAVHIFEECRGITSTACLVDSKGTSGLGTTTISEEVINPDGSVSTITIVSTINTDGSTTTITTINTVKVLDAGTANAMNIENKDFEIVLNIIVLGLLGVVTGGLAMAVASSAASAGLVGAGITAGASGKAVEIIGGTVIPGLLEGAIQIKQNHDPDRVWQEGDTITNTITIVTTTQPDINQPEDDIPPPSDITNTTVISDKDGKIISTDTRGIETTGTLK